MTAINYKLLNAQRFAGVYNWSVHYSESIEQNYSEKFQLKRIGNFLFRNKKQIIIEDDKVYKRVTIRINGGGISIRDEEIGKEIGTKSQFLIEKDQFLVSKIDARNGAFGVVPNECDGAIITGNFWTFDVDYVQINPHYLKLFTSTKHFQELCQRASNGTTNRNYLQEGLFLNMEIPLPDLTTQNQLVNQYNQNLAKAQEAENQADELEKGIEDYLLQELGIEKPKPVEKKQGLQLVSFKELNSWSLEKILYDSENDFDEFQRLSNKTNVECAFRGKSPKYEDNREAMILNQKCNRWNEIKLEFAKSVSKNWVDSIDNKFKTVENDILINSTGDGTIGRSSLVTKDFEGLIYDSHILLVRLNQNLINPLFFVYQFNSTFIQNQIEQIKSAQSTKQTELGLDNLFKLNFSIPPRAYKDNGEIDTEKDIQSQIVNHITSQKEQIKALRTQAEALRKQAKADFENEIFN